MSTVPSQLSNEDAAQFRTAQVVEDLAPAKDIVDRARTQVLTYRDELLKAATAAEARLAHLRAELRTVDEFLAGDPQYQNSILTREAEEEDERWPDRTAGYRPTDLRERGVSGRDHH